jgi:hypothetical protein
MGVCFDKFYQLCGKLFVENERSKEKKTPKISKWKLYFSFIFTKEFSFLK